MQSFRSLLVPAVLTIWVQTAPELTAQEPEATPPAVTEPEPAPAENQQPQLGPGDGTRRRGRRAPLIVIEAGTVHPVAGPPITNGVVVIRGERILAVGEQGDLGLPADTVVHSFPNGHVYPGLIDAQTDAFTDRSVQADGSLDGGMALADALVWVDERDDQLVEAGITTAYVTVRSPAQLRGQGAIVRPRAGGFDVWPEREQAALQLRMTNGQGPSHPLQRQQQLAGITQLFEGLDGFREAKEKYDEALDKYNKDFEAYLDFHRKKTKAGGTDKPATTEAPTTEGAKPAEAEGAARGRRGRSGGPPPGGGGELERPSDDDVEKALMTLLAVLAEQATAESTDAQDPQGQEPAGGQGGRRAGGQGPGSAGAAKADPAKADAGPKRPTYPKQPNPDPQKEALLRVLDGELPLRVEAHRPDELQAALRLQREQEIPLLVLEQAYAADRVAKEIAGQAATVVLTEVLPNSLGRAGDDSNPYDAFDPTALPARLDAAGVPFAIASGGARLAPLLPLMAAAAVGQGLPPEAALRAITLTPAEVLGISADTGSLVRGKFADVLVMDGPLLATDSRVLMVFAKGRTEYEVR